MSATRFPGSDVPAHCRKSLQSALIETASCLPDAISLLQPEDRRKFSEQILASAHAGAKVSKQFAALEHAVVGYMSQMEGMGGGAENADVQRGLEAAMNSSQSQNAAAAIIDREYNDNLRRLASNLQKHTAAGDDDEIVFQDSVSINVVCPVSKSVMTAPRKLRDCKHYVDLESAKAILRMPKRNKHTGRMETLCPVPGCKRPFVEGDLLMAPEVEHEIQRQRESGPSQRMSQSQHVSSRRNIHLGD